MPLGYFGECQNQIKKSKKKYFKIVIERGKIVIERELHRAASLGALSLCRGLSDTAGLLGKIKFHSNSNINSFW